jgi:hypothetical protein
MQNYVVMRIMYPTKMTQSFKVASHPLDILHSPSPSILETDDFDTKKVTCSVFRVCVLDSRLHAAWP